MRRYISVFLAFLIVLPGCDQVNAASHAERLRVAVSRMVVVASPGLATPLGLSR